MKEFKGKTAVVTGAASGIGFGLAEKFAQEQMQVVLADIEEEALERAVEKLEKMQHRVVGIQANVMVKESVEELYAKATSSTGTSIYCAITLESERILAINRSGKWKAQTGTGHSV